MLVLYATQTLGMGPIGFGLLTTVVAVGGVVGTAGYDWLERHVRLATIMRAGLIVETFTHLGLAVTTTPWGAMTILFAFGAHAFIWSTTERTVRMRAVPAALQGRVGSLYSIGVFGGLVAGQAVGGVVAKVWGVTAPFWFAFGRLRRPAGAALAATGAHRACRRGRAGGVTCETRSAIRSRQPVLGD